MESIDGQHINIRFPSIEDFEYFNLYDCHRTGRYRWCNDLGRLKTDLIGVPHEAGVYIFTDSTGKIVYVGESQDLRKRFNAHDILKECNDIFGVYWLVVFNECERLVLEKSYIMLYRPLYNKEIKLRIGMEDK